MVYHHFHLNANWSGGKQGSGYIDAGNLKADISIPKEMNGPGIGTNPDEMLLSAAATCYLITLAAMIERTEIPIQEISLNSEGIVDFTHGITTYKKIIHKPKIILTKRATDQSYKKVQQLVEKAESSCMISRAIKNNVTLELQGNII